MPSRRDGSGIGILKGRDGTHERAFAGAIRTKQAEHVIADREGDVLECLNAIGVGFRNSGDG